MRVVPSKVLVLFTALHLVAIHAAVFQAVEPTEAQLVLEFVGMRRSQLVDPLFRMRMRTALATHGKIDISKVVYNGVTKARRLQSATKPRRMQSTLLPLGSFSLTGGGSSADRRLHDLRYGLVLPLSPRSLQGSTEANRTIFEVVTALQHIRTAVSNGTLFQTIKFGDGLPDLTDLVLRRAELVCLELYQFHEPSGGCVEAELLRIPSSADATLRTAGIVLGIFIAIAVAFSIWHRITTRRQTQAQQLQAEIEAERAAEREREAKLATTVPNFMKNNSNLVWLAEEKPEYLERIHKGVVPTKSADPSSAASLAKSFASSIKGWKARRDKRKLDAAVADITNAARPMGQPADETLPIELDETTPGDDPFATPRNQSPKQSDGVEVFAASPESAASIPGTELIDMVDDDASNIALGIHTPPRRTFTKSQLRIGEQLAKRDEEKPAAAALLMPLPCPVLRPSPSRGLRISAPRYDRLSTSLPGSASPAHAMSNPLAQASPPHSPQRVVSPSAGPRSGPLSPLHRAARDCHAVLSSPGALSRRLRAAGVREAPPEEP